MGGRKPVGERNAPFVEYIGRTKVVRVMDDPARSPEDVAKISVLRRERWLLLADYAATSVSDRADRDSECQRLRQRLACINAELYTLTKNPIYDN